jgi:ribosomal protein S18 acetylase RimI-like enzyme
MDKIKVILGDINNDSDAQNMLKMLDLYMQDPMGGSQRMSPELAAKNLDGLRQQSNFLFFLAFCDGEVAGVANCFINYSTFKAKQILNIHDFATSPQFRRRGVGEAMMKKIVEFTRINGFCKITLEVRHDNHGAQKLYKKTGFTDSDVPMYFWSLEV